MSQKTDFKLANQTAGCDRHEMVNVLPVIVVPAEFVKRN